MTNREALVKSLFWRFVIAIPAALLLTYLIIGQLYNSIILVGITNFVGTILYYLFDILWFKYLGDAFGFDKVVK